jgi:repressor LexA
MSTKKSKKEKQKRAKTKVNPKVNLKVNEGAGKITATATGSLKGTSKSSEGPCIQPLTAKEKTVLDFIVTEVKAKGISPSYQEIQTHFGFASINSVQSYLKQLVVKNYIFVPGGNMKRAIQILHTSDSIQRFVSRTEASKRPVHLNLVSTGSSSFELLQKQKETLSLPLLGRVAAGNPIEAHEHDEFLDVPPSMVRYPARTFALKVQGQSMIEAGILDGDVVLVQMQDDADNGEIVVAIVEGEATLKKLFKNTRPEGAEVSDGRWLELRPANAKMRSMWFRPHEVEISGVLIGLIRRLS